jgi:hypothetical protein
MILALTGVKRSGKDSAATFLASLYCVPNEGNEVGFVRNLHFTGYHFADSLKKALETIYGWDKSIWDSPEKEIEDPFWGISPRLAAQLLGTEWSMLLADRSPGYAMMTGRRTYVKALLRLAEQSPGKNYVVSDMRFQYEVSALHEFGLEHNTPIHTLRIRRPTVETTIDPHPSEQEILSLDVDAEIVNDGTIEDLYANVDVYARSIGLTLSRG